MVGFVGGDGGCISDDFYFAGQIIATSRDLGPQMVV